MSLTFGKYQRIQTAGDLQERAEQDGGGCMIFQGALTHNGYGRISYNGMPWRAHRLAWTLTYGPIPKGMQVLHRCDVRACMEPGHLFLGTPADNMADMDSKGRRAKQPKGEASPAAKLTRRGAKRLLRIWEDEGLSVRALGRRVGISKSQAHRIITGEQWAHLERELASA